MALFDRGTSPGRKPVVCPIWLKGVFFVCLLPFLRKKEKKKAVSFYYDLLYTSYEKVKYERKL